MAQFGVAAGLLLLAIVTATGIWLAATAEKNVKRFREEHHEPFHGDGPA